MSILPEDIINIIRHYKNYFDIIERRDQINKSLKDLVNTKINICNCQIHEHYADEIKFNIIHVLMRLFKHNNIKDLEEYILRNLEIYLFDDDYHINCLLSMFNHNFINYLSDSIGFLIIFFEYFKNQLNNSCCDVQNAEKLNVNVIKLYVFIIKLIVPIAIEMHFEHECENESILYDYIDIIDKF